MKSNGELKPTKQYWVYTLGHPNGTIFYVGKGSGNRIQSHFAEARTGTCHCLKCLRIRKIWKDRLDVQVGYLFETDNEKEAFAHEAEAILVIGRNHPITNQCGIIAGRQPRGPRQAVGLSLAEYKEHLSRYDIPRKQLQDYIQEWGMLRTCRLEEQWRKARRQHNAERAKAIEEEIDAINIATGNVWQHRLDLGPITKNKVK